MKVTFVQMAEYVLKGALDGGYGWAGSRFTTKLGDLVFSADSLSTCQAQEMQKQVSAICCQEQPRGGESYFGAEDSRFLAALEMTSLIK